jgi:Cof subfamily protein (haloacid dehalogenase superfamily)
LDIDGTLLNSKHKITEKTKEVIGKVTKEKGIPVVLVSARMPEGILFLQKELDISEPIICYSGALILNKNAELLLSKYIEVSYTNEIFNAVQQCNMHMSIYKDDEWYIEKMDEWAKQEKDITNIVPRISKYKELFDKWGKTREGSNKILCMGKPEPIKLLRDKLKKIFKESLNIYMSKPTYLEIMPKEASKTSAIEFLLKKYNLDRTRIIAIGDNYNDIDMIEYAGLGIAMGNAPDCVKEIADYITLSNDEDGVAYAIMKYILT